MTATSEPASTDAPAAPVGEGARDPMRILLIAGAGGVVVGLGLIGLGWLGASRTRDVAEQIPYEISGGMFGLALVVVGSLACIAAVLERLTNTLRAVAGGTAVAGVASAAGAERYFATVGGTMYHRATCPVATTTAELRAASAGEAMTPCGICEPGPLT